MNEQYRYALVIEYLGTNFAGSQVQPNQKTIQSEIEQAVNILLKENNKIIMAGRTDAGVHAIGQAAHFNTDREIDEKRFIYSLNSLLPDDIGIKGIMQVDKTFHAQKSALYRYYRYLINNNPQKSVFLKDTSLHIPQALNVEEMNNALQYLLGSHDCSSFKRSNTNNPAKSCNILHVSCKSFSDIIHIDLLANRFLYNMVRTITGTLIQIGMGKYTKKHMRTVLEAKDRKFAGPTAEARGLTLMCVGYDEKYKLKEIMKTEALNK